MNWLTCEQQAVIKRLAAQAPEQELCGFVLENGSVVQCQNIALDPVNQFEIAPHDYAKWDEQGIAGVWHTHLELDAFSPLDQQVLASDQLPWAVYCLRTDRFHQVDPLGIAPLLGRPFCFGVYDCYSLITDKLSEMGVQLPEWPRGRYGEWNTPLFNPFDAQASNVGRQVTNGVYAEGDILLMNLGDHAGHTDHVGVFVTEKTFLHHPSERQSRIDVYGSWWKRKTRLVLRPYALWKSSKQFDS